MRRKSGCTAPGSRWWVYSEYNGKVIINICSYRDDDIEVKILVNGKEAMADELIKVNDQKVSYPFIIDKGDILEITLPKEISNQKNEDEKIETGLKKFGAMVGDNVEVGCGSVLNPGTVVGRNTNIYPLSSVRGVIAENSIYKNRGEVVFKIM